jgi:hypothetical protein
MAKQQNRCEIYSMPVIFRTSTRTIRFTVALERMGTAKLDLLPVVSRADIHYLIGVVVLADVLNSYGVKHGH